MLTKIADHPHEIHAVHVAPEGEEQRLTERQQAREAPEQIHGDREQRVAEIFSPEVDREIADDTGGIQRGQDHDQEQREEGDGGDLDPPCALLCRLNAER